MTLLGVSFMVFDNSNHASALSLAQSNITGDLIDDSAFRDNSTMTPTQIESFLQNEGSGLATYKTLEDCGNTSDPNYSYFQRYYHCGTQQLAAQIIYDSAQAYGINPQVILATLQKEQSLITTPNPTTSQLNKAMGYGCPDSGGCGYTGFFAQVDGATWQFRADWELGSGNSWWGKSPSAYLCNGATNYYSAALKAGNTVTFKDDNGTPYETFTLANMATATLYCYTPHVYNNPNGINGLPKFGTTGLYYSGSYNFVYYFTLWFGSTTGDLVRTTSNSQVYLINTDTNTKYPINSLRILDDFSVLGLRYVDSSYLAQFTAGQAVGNMVQGPDGTTLYLINSGIKLPFSSCSDVTAYGFTCTSSSFVPITIGQANKLANGPHVSRLLKSNTNGTVYYIENGQKRPFSSWGDLTSLNIPININVLSNVFVQQYPTGVALYGIGSLVKAPSSATVYVVSTTDTLMPITSFNYPKELGLSTSLLRTITDSALQQTYNSAQSATNLSNMVACSSTNYVGVGGALYAVSSAMASAYGFNTNNFTDIGNALCGNLKISSQSLSQYIRVGNSIYQVSDGQKHAFSSYGIYQSPAYCNNTCTYTQVSPFFASSIPEGSNITN
jgi:hypothetical protein